MEEHIYLIRSYLPVEFEDEDTNEFIEYLVSAYLENLPNEKYQFSFTAFHMLYMSYIYKIKWLLKEQGNVLIEDSIQEYVKQNRGATFKTLFDFSQMSEKTTLDKLLKTLSFHVNDVDLCKNLVEVRNKCSHASGKVYFKRQQQVENYILEELDSIGSIQKKVAPFLKTIFEDFIEETWDLNWIDLDLKNWVLKSFLSQNDIEILLKLKPSFLRHDSISKEIIYKKILHAVLINEMSNYLEEKGDHLLKSLTSLMKGIVKHVDIRKDPNDSEKLKSTEELIEEKILPLITSLSSEDAIKAQEILQLAT